MQINQYLKSFMSLIFPVTCANCSKPLVDQEELLCLHCYFDLPKTGYHQMTNNPMIDQLSGLVKIEGAYAFLKYTKKGMAQKLVHQLKYGGSQKVGQIMGKWFANEIKSTIEETHLDYIIPVPIHPSRLMKRGYNQSFEIANGMSEVLGIPVKTKAIKRIHMAQSQAKKRKLDRLTNLHVEYEVIDTTIIEGKNILLIDDVITTGATITAVTSLLLENGAAMVSVCCLATGK